MTVVTNWVILKKVTRVWPRLAVPAGVVRSLPPGKVSRRSPPVQGSLKFNRATLARAVRASR